MSKSKQIAALISSFPMQNNSEPEAAMAGFEIAVSDYSDHIVSSAVFAFLRGQVVGHNGKWLPTPAELAKQCEVFEAPRRRMSVRDQIAKQSLKYLEAPKQQPLEERKEAHERIMGNANHFFDQIENERVGDAGGGEAFKGLTADDLGDPRPIEERLNIRDSKPAFYEHQETKPVGGLARAEIDTDDFLDNLGVKVDVQKSA